MSLLWYWCWLLLIILDGQVHKILVCSWLILCSLSRGYQVGVYFLALCFRGFSSCILVDFLGLGAAGLVCSGGRLLSRCSFHFRRGWMPPCVFVLLSVIPSARNNSTPYVRILIKFDIWVLFENLSRKYKLQQNTSYNKILYKCHSTNIPRSFMFYRWYAIKNVIK